MSKIKSAERNQLTGAFNLLKPSWQAVKLNYVTLFELILIPVMFSILSSVVRDRSIGVANLVGALGDVVALTLAPALIIAQLKSARYQEVEFTDTVKAGLPFVWRYICLIVCIAVMVLGGFLLLIVPGFIMLRRYYLAPYYLIDRNLSVSAALKASAADSKQFNLQIWSLLGVDFLFVALSLVIVGIILFIMYYCAPAIRYLEIDAATKSE